MNEKQVSGRLWMPPARKCYLVPVPRTSVSQAVRDLLAVYDRIEEAKTDRQNIVQRLAVLDPLIQEFKVRIEVLRQAIEEDG